MLRRNFKIKNDLYYQLKKYQLKAKGRPVSELNLSSLDSDPEVLQILLNHGEEMLEMTRPYINKTVWQIICQILSIDQKQIDTFEDLSPQLENHSCLFLYNANLEEMVRDNTFFKLNQAEEIIAQLGLSAYREVPYKELRPETKYMISLFILTNKG